MTLTSQIVYQFFSTTLHLMIIHHHTKFAEKWLNGSDILSGQNQTHGQNYRPDKSDSNSPPPRKWQG